MKKIIAALLIAGSTVFFASAEKKSNDNSQALNDALTTVGNSLKEGAEKAGTETKNFLEKAKGKTDEETKGKAKAKANEIGQKVGDKVKEGAEKTKEAINTHATKILTGTLSCKGKGKKATFTFKAEDGNTYKVRTISNSTDSLIKLSAYNGMKIKISGILNTETNEITLTTYKLAEEE